MNGRGKRRLSWESPLRRRVSRPLLALCLLVLPHACDAASLLDPTGHFAVQWWTADDGLPETPVTGAAFAPDGSLVCCTPRHLVRFDGSAFDPLPATLVEPLAGRIGEFWSVAFDGEGRLWVQGSHAVARLVGSAIAGEGRWVVHTLTSGTINSMAIAGDGRPVFVGPGLVLAFDGTRVVSLPIEQPGRTTAAWRYGTVDRTTDDLWLWGNDETGRHLFKAGRPPDRRGPVVLEPAVADVAKATIALGTGPAGVCALLKDRVAVHGPDGWRRLDPELPAPDVRESGQVVRAGDGTSWVATHSGLLACRDGRIATVIQGVPGFPAFTYRLVVDDSDGVWAACSGGLLAVRRTRLRPTPIRDCGAVWRRPDGALLVGVPGTVMLVPADAGSPARPLARLPEAAVPTAIVEDADGRIWVGTRNSFLFRIDTPGGDARQITWPAEHYQELRSITALAVDPQGRVWAGTNNGLSVHDAARDVFTPVLGHQSRDRTYVIGLAPDPDGAVVVATLTRGVERVAADGAKTTVLQAGEMPGRKALALARDAAGTIWVGGDRGLVRIAADGTKSHLRSTHGLVCEAIRQVTPDGRGRLWLATRDGHVQGISTAALDEFAAGRAAVVHGIVLGPIDGLGDGECTGRIAQPAVPAADSAIVLPLSDGVARFDPAAFTTPATAPAPRVVVTRAAPQVADLRVPGLHWGDPPLLQTLLEGGDTAWTPPTADRSRTLERLSPGRHRLRVRVLAGETDRDFPETNHEIVVPTPWWQSGWFTVGIAAGAAGAAAAASRELTRRRARRRIADLERQQAMDRERARIARDIHDSLGAGLTRVALASDLARRDGASPADVRGRLDAISTTTRGLARSVDEIVWAVNPRNDTLDRFISYVVDDVEATVRDGGLELHLDIPDALPGDRPLAAHVRHHLCLAVREALQNVLRHAGAARVDFAVAVSEDALVVTVADDGAGFAADGAAAAGQDGLANMQARLAEAGGRVAIDTAPGRGTRIRFSIPLPPHNSDHQGHTTGRPHHVGHTP